MVWIVFALWLVLTPVWISYWSPAASGSKMAFIPVWISDWSPAASGSKMAFIPPALALIGVVFPWLWKQLIVHIAGESEPSTRRPKATFHSVWGLALPSSGTLRVSLIAAVVGACAGAGATKVLDRSSFHTAISGNSAAGRPTDQSNSPINSPTSRATDQSNLTTNSPTSRPTDQSNLTTNSPTSRFADQSNSLIYHPDSRATDQSNSPINRPAGRATDQSNSPISAPEVVNPQSRSSESKIQDSSPLTSPYSTPRTEGAGVQMWTEQNSSDQPHCDVSLCERYYRSFRASDCTYQPYAGPRQYCTR
jgi:hypothetical protein